MENVTIISNKILDCNEINGIKIIPPYKNQNLIIFRFLRKIGLKLKLKSFLINKKKVASLNGTVIIFDSVITIHFLNWFKDNSNASRIIFWYWNPVEKSIPIESVPKEFEIWSYSRSDCDKYGLKWNSTFAIDSLVNFKKSNQAEYDIVFIGRKKGREEYVKKFISCVSNLGFKTKTVFVRNKFFDLRNMNLPRSLNYQSYLEIENKSKAIIDFNSNPDSGMTLRALEALFLNKKLILNYHEPLNSHIPCSNLFYVDQDCKFDKDELSRFMETKVVDSDNGIKEFYTFNSWLERFKV